MGTRVTEHYVMSGHLVVNDGYMMPVRVKLGESRDEAMRLLKGRFSGMAWKIGSIEAVRESVTTEDVTSEFLEHV